MEQKVATRKSFRNTQPRISNWISHRFSSIELTNWAKVVCQPENMSYGTKFDEYGLVYIHWKEPVYHKHIAGQTIDTVTIPAVMTCEHKNHQFTNNPCAPHEMPYEPLLIGMFSFSWRSCAQGANSGWQDQFPYISHQCLDPAATY